VSFPKKPKPPGVSIGAARVRQAREFLVLHPDMSKSQAAAATGISEATIGRARRDLVAEGTLAPARNAPVRPAPEPEATQPPEAKAPEDGSTPPNPPAASPAPKKGGATLLDHAALLELANMVDAAIESGDDETIQKRLSKQALVFAFRTDLHPDTRMSASQMYYKLKDMAKAKDLGPGKPKTFALGVDRLADVLTACGPEMTMAAVHKAFEVKGGEATNEQAPSPDGTPQAPGAAGHDGANAPVEMVRGDDVRTERPGEGLQDHDNAGPTEGRPDNPGPPRTPSHLDSASPWS
jgi:hypothetical protein